MPDQGFIAACPACDWVALDEAGNVATFGQLEALAACDAHVEAHRRIHAERVAAIAERVASELVAA